jgi:hypothetical protein
LEYIFQTIRQEYNGKESWIRSWGYK